MPAKRRIVVALLLSTTAASAAPAQPPVDRDGFPLVGNVTAKSPGPPVRRAPPPDDQVPEHIRTLRAELFDKSREPEGRAAVVAAMAHFRPLCDAEGYPLVGNVSSKWNNNPPMQPSAFCAVVREKEGK
jgi:hypothetical protein